MLLSFYLGIFCKMSLKTERGFILVVLLFTQFYCRLWLTLLGAFVPDTHKQHVYLAVNAFFILVECLRHGLSAVENGPRNKRQLHKRYATKCEEGIFNKDSLTMKALRFISFLPRHGAQYFTVLVIVFCHLANIYALATYLFTH